MTEVAGPPVGAARILRRVKAALAVALASLVACAGPRPIDPVAPPPRTAASPSAAPKRIQPLACPAGGVVGDVEPRPDCADRGPSCVAACDAGDRQSCYWLAQAVLAEPATADDAQPLFHRACELGHASGCTNYGAKLVVDHGDLDCANRLFERACAVDDPHGCGMMAHMLFGVGDRAQPSDTTRERVRAHLEVTCARIGHFPCHVLAGHVRHGTFGPADAARADELLARACETGDHTACEELPASDGAAAP